MTPAVASASASSLALVARAVAATGSGISIADATVVGFPLTYVNAAFEERTGYAADECIGRNCHFLQGPGTAPRAVAELSCALREGRDARVVLLNNRKDGTPFFNELRLSPVRDDHGRLVQVVGVQNDVSNLVHAQRGLELDRDRVVAELRILREALAPTEIPARPQLELAGLMVPAEQGVSGDFHLVAAGPNGTTVLVVGDAMGHGLDAARRAVYARTTMAMSAPFTDDPQRLLALANQALIERAGTSAQFVTAVCAVYLPRERRLRWASAGHPIPRALDSGEPIGKVARAGRALGLELELDGTSGEIGIEPGDGVLLFTDGLGEARAAHAGRRGAPRLGDQRVGELIERLAGRSPREVVETLHAAARAHAGGSFADDLCLLAARAT